MIDFRPADVATAPDTTRPRRFRSYYIRFSSYWQNATNSPYWENPPDYFAGPFPTRAACEAEIDRANNVDTCNYVRAYLGQLAPDVRNDMRIAAIHTRTAAQRAGMRDTWKNSPTEINTLDSLTSTPRQDIDHTFGLD